MQQVWGTFVLDFLQHADLWPSYAMSVKGELIKVKTKKQAFLHVNSLVIFTNIYWSSDFASNYHFFSKIVLPKLLLWAWVSLPFNMCDIMFVLLPHCTQGQRRVTMSLWFLVHVVWRCKIYHQHNERPTKQTNKKNIKKKVIYPKQ